MNPKYPVYPMQIWRWSHVFQSLYGPFRLTISLWMKGSVEVQFGAHCRLKSLPKLRGKLSIPVRYYWEGTPCNRTISLMYSSTSCSALKVDFIAKKCADLVSRSTITELTLWYLLVRGILITKSIVICSYFQTGMGKGSNKSSGFWCFVFTHWQVRHRATNSVMSLFIPGHQ